MIKNLNISLYQDFVDPNICQQLVNAGLDAPCHFHWRQNGANCQLHTRVFDYDGYYSLPLSVIDSLSKTKYIPAYSVGDMIRLLPGFMLTHNNNEFEFNADELFKMDVQTGARLPDVLATAVLNGLLQHKLDAAKCKEILTRNEV